MDKKQQSKECTSINAAPRPCTFVGCSKLVRDGNGRCEAHRHLHTNRFGDRARGSRHERGYGTAWDKVRQFVLTRDMGLCQPCWKAGRITPGREVDHIVNRQQGGTDDPANLQCICRDCHKAKTTEEARR